MVSQIQVDDLKNLLRQEVALFCQRDNRQWKSEVWKTVDEIRNNRWPAVFFGGTLRSLLVSRIIGNRMGRPRDVDIVVRGIGVEDLAVQFKNYVSRHTRFGGVQLWRRNYQFDLWPLHKTFAFESTPGEPEFSDLPKTTFLNVEAIAIDVWPKTGKPRVIYSGNEQFFKSIISRTLEMNNESNPFPQLCVARSLVIASDLQWKVGPQLLEYLRVHSLDLSEDDFQDVQRKHYGGIRLDGSVLTRVKDFLSNVKNVRGPVELPLPKQLTLWDDNEQIPRFRITVVTQPKNRHRSRSTSVPS